MFLVPNMSFSAALNLKSDKLLGNCFPSSDLLALHGRGKVGVQTIHLVELANNRTTARRPHPGIRHDDQAWHVPTEAYLAPNADSVGRGAVTYTHLTLPTMA